jgi:hypothetical protein
VAQVDQARSIVETFDLLPANQLPPGTFAAVRLRPFFRPFLIDGSKLSAGLDFEPTLRADPARTQVYAALGHCETVVSVAVLHATA